MGRVYFSTSKSIGEGVDISWTNTVETFEYNSVLLNLSLDEETNSYVANIETLPVEDFDGDNNEYRISINETICSKTSYGAGKISGSLHKVFEDIDGNVIADTTLEVQISFYMNKTVIDISCSDSETAVTCWQNYFKNFGFRLSVENILGVEND